MVSANYYANGNENWFPWTMYKNADVANYARSILGMASDEGQQMISLNNAEFTRLNAIHLLLSK